MLIAGLVCTGVAFFMVFAIMVASKSLSLFASPYRAEYEVIQRNNSPYMKVTVNGPAAKLAIILTDPSGKSDVETIEPEQMITNSKVVFLEMHPPQDGNYILAIKTFTPEKIVAKEKITFSLEKMWVKNCELNTRQIPLQDSDQPIGLEIQGIYVGVEKQGNLPIVFSKADIFVGGKPCRMSSIAKGSSMVDSRQIVYIEVSCQPTKEMEERDRQNTGSFHSLPCLFAIFRPGDKYVMEGKLFYNGKTEFVTFRKELYFEDGMFRENKGSLASMDNRR
jgi:hypothetical protein